MPQILGGFGKKVSEWAPILSAMEDFFNGAPTVYGPNGSSRIYDLQSLEECFSMALEIDVHSLSDLNSLMGCLEICNLKYFSRPTDYCICR